MRGWHGGVIESPRGWELEISGVRGGVLRGVLGQSVMTLCGSTIEANFRAGRDLDAQYVRTSFGGGGKPTLAF